MAVYPASARERAMKAQEVILRALSKQITFWQAARQPSELHSYPLPERPTLVGSSAACRS